MGAARMQLTAASTLSSSWPTLAMNPLARQNFGGSTRQSQHSTVHLWRANLQRIPVLFYGPLQLPLSSSRLQMGPSIHAFGCPALNWLHHHHLMAQYRICQSAMVPLILNCCQWVQMSQ